MTFNLIQLPGIPKAGGIKGWSLRDFWKANRDGMMFQEMGATAEKAHCLGPARWSCFGVGTHHISLLPYGGAFCSSWSFQNTPQEYPQVGPISVIQTGGDKGISDCEQVLPIQEQVQLAHHTKLYKEPSGHSATCYLKKSYESNTTPNLGTRSVWTVQLSLEQKIKGPWNLEVLQLQNIWSYMIESKPVFPHPDPRAPRQEPHGITRTATASHMTWHSAASLHGITQPRYT